MQNNYLTFGDIYRQVARFSKDTSSSFQTMIKDEIQRCYLDAVSRHDWPELRRVDTSFTFSTSSSYMYFPSFVNQILAVVDLTAANFVDPTKIEYMAWMSPATFNTSGSTLQWAHAGDSPIFADFSSTPEVLRFSSGSSSDTTQLVRISGIDSNNTYVTEQITLNGTGYVDTASTWKDIENVSCDDDSRVGVIIYFGLTSLVTYERIPASDKTIRYKRIRLLQPPSTANSIAVVYKKTARQLKNDDDVPEIPISAYLRERAMAVALEYDENWAAATQHIQLAEQELDNALRASTGGADDAVMTRPWIRPRATGSRFTIERP